ncbi:immune inhibitor A domain-containing protein [Xylanimonas sp. McL0601]|uniref:immune inhibitor A domain-containing protein n=1 Tax=Xylanimonas sp. McL0601 TaxID=3414739 RepID=UPI003CF84460
MKARLTSAIGAAAIVVAGAVVVPVAASAAPASDQPVQQTAPARSDDRPDPLAAKQRDAKQEAAQLVATGDAKVQTRGTGKYASKVVQVAPGKFVEYGTQETAQLLTFLVDFGDGDGGANTTAPAGPVHNTIPEPDRANDNSTYWEKDFSAEHYKEMFFSGLKDQGGESFHDVYDQMSSGRFDLQGDVSDWVTLPHREAYYGDGDDPSDDDDVLDGSETQAGMTAFIQDSANAWYADQLAKGKTKDQIVAYLKSFDVWDRYDIDGDGIINEPDGYVDHFQAIHAGTGEEAGADPWTIWSHRWAVNQAGVGKDGPADFPKVGGIRIGDTDLWIRDYTTEPENGGLGVFSHEFGHDLGLPDYYDTDGGENGTGYWNLMSSGSWMGHGTDTIGTTPNHMGATEKLFLGWLDYAAVAPGKSTVVDLGPSYHATTRGAQAVVVDLPDKTETFTLVEPTDGAYVYSESRSNLNSSIASPSFTVPSGASLTAKVSYAIEQDYDYAYAEISTNDGTTWTPLSTNLSAPVGNGNPGGGITGTSGGEWVDLSADLSTYAGQTAKVRFRYSSDGGVNLMGLAIDSVAVGSALSENFDDFGDWTVNGFVPVAADGTYQKVKQHFYVAENRVYGGYDATLRTGPYNFGWAATRPDWVEHHPYEDGLLIWYVNSLWGDNNVSAHPGRGEALPVDAHPTALHWSDGALVRNRVQSFDATFGLEPTDAFLLHRETKDGMTTADVTRRPAVSVFDDTDPAKYYDPANPSESVLVGGTGTTIKVLKQNANTGVMRIQVN